MRQESRKITIWGRLLAIIIVFVDLVLQSHFRSLNFGLENRGVSFGFGQEWGSTISFFTYGAIIIWYVYEKRWLRADRWFLFLLALGGAGNLVSRVVWGSVWDYLTLPFLPFSFNLADVLISLGVVSYILGGNGNRSNLRGQGDHNHQ
jgi:lipoprotein signal peptidase